MNENWFKKHSDLLTISSIIVGAAIWMTSTVHNLEIKMIENQQDFHGRLCTLEERYAQMMQRILEGNK